MSLADGREGARVIAEAADHDSVPDVDVPVSVVVPTDPIALDAVALFGFSVACALVARVDSAVTGSRSEESWGQIADVSVVIPPDRPRPWALADPYGE